MRRGSLDQFEGLRPSLRHHHIVSPTNTSVTLRYAKYHDANRKVFGQIRPLLTEHIIFDPTDAGVSAFHVWMDRPAEMLYAAISGPLLPCLLSRTRSPSGG